MKVYPLHIYFNKYFCSDTLFSLHMEFFCAEKKKTVVQTVEK